jgi:hypothetical protein
MNAFVRISSFCLLLNFGLFECHSQNLESIKLYYDSIYGADNFLINGRIYNFPNHNAKGNPFFYGNDPKTATVMLKGRIYPDLQINYNIEEDILILYTQMNNIDYYIELSNQLVDSFSVTYRIFPDNPAIEDQTGNAYKSKSNMDLVCTTLFIRIKDLGLFELIYNDKIRLVKKYSKKFFDRVSDEKQFGYYSSQLENLYILKNDTLYNVSKKNDFLNYFNNRKDIKKYIHKKGIKYKNLNNNQLGDVLKYALTTN